VSGPSSTGSVVVGRRGRDSTPRSSWCTCRTGLCLYSFGSCVPASALLTRANSLEPGRVKKAAREALTY
jgi:hypothetical protein